MDLRSTNLAMDCSIPLIKQENQVLDLSTKPETPPGDKTSVMENPAPIQSDFRPTILAQPAPILVAYPTLTRPYPSPTHSYTSPTLPYTSPSLPYMSHALPYPSPPMVDLQAPPTLAYTTPTLPDSGHTLADPASTQAVKRVLMAAQTQNIRPFKAYPQDPAALPVEDEEFYTQFREQMMRQMKASKARPRKSSSPNQNVRKINESSSTPPRSKANSDEIKDAAYYERRRKNNIAAKRSRDSRRSKEDEIAIRAAFYERQYHLLKYQNEILTQQNKHMIQILYPNPLNDGNQLRCF